MLSNSATRTPLQELLLLLLLSGLSQYHWLRLIMSLRLLYKRPIRNACFWGTNIHSCIRWTRSCGICFVHELPNLPVSGNAEG